MTDRAILTDLFDAAVAAADPLQALTPHMPKPPKGRTIVIGAGKGAAQLAQAFETLWEGALSGVVVTRYGYGALCDRIKVMEAAHPVPDAAGLEASHALLDAVSGLGPDDLVVALVCGGGSALLPSPPDGLSLADEQALNTALLASGAPISVMNAIRKHVSMIKGGRLAKAAYPAPVLSLIVSDVPGDDPAQVASGPTVPDAVSWADALHLIKSHQIAIPPAVLAHIQGETSHAPDPADPAFANHTVKVIASAGVSLDAAVAKARALGLPAVILSDAIEGEAREIAKMHAAMALEVKGKNRPFTKPVVILS
ncbi:glycerate kinase, partial [Roseobacter sp.]|uniref:glycerate kinase type-2 family protein n=1 Tax=Roseobacter sp. TaxID=1907202 RepID=UPI003299440E